MTGPIRKLIYVGDPMCSWCWGFAPEIESLAVDYEVEVVVGGLRPGPSAQPLNDRMAESLKRHWQEVAARTGQPFDLEFLDRGNRWIYDTEPAAVAVTQLRAIREESTLHYFTNIQQAFYAEGRDVTDFDVLAELAEGIGMDREEFRATLETPAAKEAAWADFTRSRNWGIGGFPTLIGELTDGRLALLARGWTSADLIRDRISGIEVVTTA